MPGNQREPGPVFAEIRTICSMFRAIVSVMRIKNTLQSRTKFVNNNYIIIIQFFALFTKLKRTYITKLISNKLVGCSSGEGYAFNNVKLNGLLEVTYSGRIMSSSDGFFIKFRFIRFFKSYLRYLIVFVPRLNKINMLILKS